MRHSKLARRNPEPVKTKSFSLQGGINLVDAPLDIPGGMFLGASNYEMLTRSGCQRVQGHERYDGQAKASDASYWILNFDAGDIVEPEVDGICEGVTSGATGKVGLVTLTSGTWAGSDAAGSLVLFVVSGTFQNNESLTFTGGNDGFSTGFSSGFG